MNDKIDLKTIELWIRTQIARPNADPIKPRCWYKYARDCKEWSHLTHGHAPNFCRLARMAGQNINQEYRGLDIIKLHFPGIWANSENQKKWQTI